MAPKLPIVTIVGRQNVGKSTLFNAIIKEKRAIVDSFPGLTRDIISFTVNYNTVSFILTDTPGLDLPSTSELSGSILENARNHLQRSSVIILLLEKPAPDSFDIDLTDFIRKLSIPTIIAVNKIDNEPDLEHMANFYETGYKEIMPISAKRNFNLKLLLDTVINLLPQKKTSTLEPDVSISIVGRPNSGKSTLLNTFLGYERAVVSPIPGTTRDAVDDYIMFHKKTIRIIDTAGIRKKSKINENIEFYSFTRTQESIAKSDIVIHVIDAEMGITDTDKKISDEIIKAKKPIIIAINKWDLIEKDDKTFKQFKEKIIFKYYRAEDFPIISISAKEKKRTHKLLELALELKEKSSKKIPTPEFNRLIGKLLNSNAIPQLGHKLKILYAAQIRTLPPEFKFFVNNADFFRKDVIRYFEKSLQRELDLKGVPIIIKIEGRKKAKNKK